jgi:hypothetical protein
LGERRSERGKRSSIWVLVSSGTGRLRCGVRRCEPVVASAANGLGFGFGLLKWA